MKARKSRVLPSTPFYFVRHGQTDWNKKRLYMGSTDIPLNEEGLQQAQEVAKLLQNESFFKIISSPQKRAMRTAQIIGEISQKPVTTLSELKECSWGEGEGLPVQDNVFEGWFKGKTPSSGEPFLDFEKRIAIGLKKALCGSELPVLLVSHGAVYFAVQRILGVNSPVRLGNCQAMFHAPPITKGGSWAAVEVSVGLEATYQAVSL